MGNPQSQHPSPLTMVEFQGDEFWPLSGKPYFHVVLTRTHIGPSLYQMILPDKMYPELPSTKVPVLLTYRAKNWEMTYNGDLSKRRRFDRNWRSFVDDNGLNVGDACIFELVNCSSEEVNFKVQILRGDLPPEYQEMITGEKADAPICIE